MLTPVGLTPPVPLEEEEPAYCPACGDLDPFCGTCRGEQPVRTPETGDRVEVPVGDLWLPATVSTPAHLWPAPPDGWCGGIFNFELVGSNRIAGAAFVVDDYGRRWRWPGRRP